MVGNTTLANLTTLSAHLQTPWQVPSCQTLPYDLAALIIDGPVGMAAAQRLTMATETPARQRWGQATLPPALHQPISCSILQTAPTQFDASRIVQTASAQSGQPARLDRRHASAQGCAIRRHGRSALTSRRPSAGSRPHRTRPCSVTTILRPISQYVAVINPFTQPADATTSVISRCGPASVAGSISR
jgi:hypothetical protein